MDRFGGYSNVTYKVERTTERKMEGFQMVKAVEIEEETRVKAPIEVSVPLCHIIFACNKVSILQIHGRNRRATLID